MRDVVHQIREGNRSVVGFMVESFIEAGNQPIPADLSKLRYGCSVTDACVELGHHRGDAPRAPARSCASSCRRGSGPFDDRARCRPAR